MRTTSQSVAPQLAHAQIALSTQLCYIRAKPGLRVEWVSSHSFWLGDGYEVERQMGGRLGK
jgi:hypothetical protein